MRESEHGREHGGREQRAAVPLHAARDIILSSIRPLGTERIGLGAALGRVLAEDIKAERSIPPLDNSAMDGYAVRSEDVQRVPARLTIVETLPAGVLSTHKLGPGEAARILTGAAIPDGADAVVMQEHTETEPGAVTILKTAARGDHIRRVGSDVRPDTPIGWLGNVLRPAQLGMFAAVGRTQIRVSLRPRVAILATGDELVEPDRPVDGGRIVTSNSYGLYAALQEAGADPVYLGIARDEPRAIADAFREALRCDAVVSTGGVSVGDRDWIKQVLGELGGELKLWRVLMKPGAPLAFVVLNERPVFGLPGNPVSTLVTFEQFVRPALLRMTRQRAIFRPVERAVLAEDYRKAADRPHFVRVRLAERDGRRIAFSTGDQGSGILLSMVRAEGLAIVPLETTYLPAGSEVTVQMLQRTDLRDVPGF